MLRNCFHTLHAIANIGYRQCPLRCGCLVKVYLYHYQIKIAEEKVLIHYLQFCTAAVIPIRCQQTQEYKVDILKLIRVFVFCYWPIIQY